MTTQWRRLKTAHGAAAFADERANAPVLGASLGERVPPVEGEDEPLWRKKHMFRFVDARLSLPKHSISSHVRWTEFIDGGDEDGGASSAGLALFKAGRSLILLVG